MTDASALANCPKSEPPLALEVRSRERSIGPVKQFVRVLIGVLGLLGLAAALMFWVRPESAAAGVGLAMSNATGTATVRADIAGFFGASGVFALLAAVRGRADYATVVMVLMAFALTGRIVNVLLAGWSPIFLTPMAIEALTIAIFALASRALRDPAPTP